MNRPLISVIIPRYNEAATLPDMLAQGEAVNLDKAIIVVDDHSTDATPALLAEVARDRPYLTVIRHPHAGKVPQFGAVWPMPAARSRLFKTPI